MRALIPTEGIYTVSEVAALIQGAIRREPVLGQLWVRAELSNYKRHSSGHLYMTLKDRECALRAVMFKGQAVKLNFEPETGQDCFIHGYINLYPKETQVQMYIDQMIPAGAGEAALALEALKKELQGLGYFDSARKKALPNLPKAIGVISSPTGAVIRDIQKVIWRRYPGMPILLYPAAVQGKEAVETVVAGLTAMAEAPVDVVIVARGGGSAEDMEAFNTKAVAQAVFSCPKPVISAIGHETDVTVADLVADVRAATPSMAAELAVPIKSEMEQRLLEQQQRLTSGLFRRMDASEERLQRSKESVVFASPMRLLDIHWDRLRRLDEKLQSAMEKAYSEKKNLLQQEAGRLQALSPLATLSRGYAVCRDIRKKIITSANQVELGEPIHLTLAKGELICKVHERKE